MGENEVYDTTDRWFEAISAAPSLPDHTAKRLREDGFVVVPNLVTSVSSLADAYDAVVQSADFGDVSRRSSTRVNNFVNGGAEFDVLYVAATVLAAARQIIGRPFKLSTLLGRTLELGAPTQGLHVDVQRGSADWPLAGFIVMIDEFQPENGATLFVPGSHLSSRPPFDVMPDTTARHDREVAARGAAGSVILFDGSTWHGHAANRSSRPRRSIQGAFIPRECAAAENHAAKIRSATLARIGGLARYVLDLPGQSVPPD